ncbi:LacI family DNA-binding transcriptional regulator [Streptomyces sp. NPDC054855]
MRAVHEVTEPETAVRDAAVRDVAVKELKFRKLAEQLRKGIRDGTWALGAKLPTEIELASRTGLSVTTVRRAFEELVTEGLVDRRQGAGSFVIALPRQRAHPWSSERRRIGVLVPEAEYYFAPVLKGVEAALSAAHCSMVLRTTGYGVGAVTGAVTAVEELLDAGVAGLLLTPSAPEVPLTGQLARCLQELPVPAVYLERRWARAGAADRSEHVYTDHAGGAYDALAHLARLGHRDVGLVRRLGAAPTQVVAEGFDQAVEALDLRARARIDWEPIDTHLAMRRSAEAPLALEVLHTLRNSGATAVLCFGDFESGLLLRAARAEGVQVPQDLAIVSYDDSLAADADVPLTAVAPEKFRMGALAVETLVHRLDDPEAELRQVRLRPRLTLRTSCGWDAVDLAYGSASMS